MFYSSEEFHILRLLRFLHESLLQWTYTNSQRLKLAGSVWRNSSDASVFRWRGRPLVKQVLTVRDRIGWHSKQRGQRSWIFSFLFRLKPKCTEGLNLRDFSSQKKDPQIDRNYANKGLEIQSCNVYIVLHSRKAWQL